VTAEISVSSEAKALNLKNKPPTSLQEEERKRLAPKKRRKDLQSIVSQKSPGSLRANQNSKSDTVNARESPSISRRGGGGTPEGRINGGEQKR